MTALIRQFALVFFTLAMHVQVMAAYPDKPVRFIVPFPPGGGTDAFARILGIELTKMWGQQVIVDNRAGAQGNIGTALGAKAPPDGYTLILAHQGVLTVNPHIYTKSGFDPIKDLVPVSRTTEQPFVVVVNPGVPARTLQFAGARLGHICTKVVNRLPTRRLMKATQPGSPATRNESRPGCSCEASSSHISVLPKKPEARRLAAAGSRRRNTVRARL